MGNLSVIARREFKIRLFSKANLFTLLFLTSIVTFAPWIPQLIANDQPISLGLYVESPLQMSETSGLRQSIESQAKAQGMNVKIVGAKSLSEIKAMEGEKIPVALGISTDEFLITALESGNSQLVTFINNFARAYVSDQFFRTRGLNTSDLERFLAERIPAVAFDYPDEPISPEELFTWLILATFLYYLIIFASMQFLLGVVEEKSSHVMEVLLHSTSPRQLLLGKLAGISAFVSMQFVVIITSGFVSAHFAGITDKIQLTLSSIVPLVIWFPVAYFAFTISTLILGARVTKVEDIGTVNSPFMVIATLPFYASLFAVQSPNEKWVEILSYLPPFSFYLESSRTLFGVSSIFEATVSWLIAVSVTSVVAYFGIRAFEKNILAQKPYVLSIEKLNRFRNFIKRQ